MIIEGDIDRVGTVSEEPRETFVLNVGPQHPATHGVLRVKMVMDGEYVERAEPVCGYIHRMQEKMGENRTYAQFLPNTSRIDYLSALTYTHAFVGAVERAGIHLLCANCWRFGNYFYSVRSFWLAAS